MRLSSEKYTLVDDFASHIGDTSFVRAPRFAFFILNQRQKVPAKDLSNRFCCQSRFNRKHFGCFVFRFPFHSHRDAIHVRVATPPLRLPLFPVPCTAANTILSRHAVVPASPFVDSRSQATVVSHRRAIEIDFESTPS